MTTVVAVGDRVRVVLEGEAVEAWSEGRFLIGTSDAANVVLPDEEHVVSVTVLPKPPKAGDTINWDAGGLASLPGGTLLSEVAGEMTFYFLKLHGQPGWHSAGNSSYTTDDLNDGANYTICYLPAKAEATA